MAQIVTLSLGECQLQVAATGRAEVNSSVDHQFKAHLGVGYCRPTNPPGYFGDLRPRLAQEAQAGREAREQAPHPHRGSTLASDHTLLTKLAVSDDGAPSRLAIADRGGDLDLGRGGNRGQGFTAKSECGHTV